MTTLQQHPHYVRAVATTSSNILHPRSRGRRSLQQVNYTCSGIKVEAAEKGIPDAKLIKPSLDGEFGKENVAVKTFVVEELQEMENTLFPEEEQMAVRRKVERIAIDGERVERLMDERSAVLDTKMRELDESGEVQKALEMEVDRLYRLKQLKITFTSKVTPMRSLREMEQNRKCEAGSEAVTREIKLENSRSSVDSAKSISTEE